jgi:hypothetical protein
VPGATDQNIATNVIRLIAAIGAGAIFARNLERVSWIVLLAVSISAIDLWSVFSSEGTTNKMIKQAVEKDHHGGGSSGLLDSLLLNAPRVNDIPIFNIGTTDLIFIAVFLCFAHFWRVGLARVAVMIVVTLVVALAAATYRTEGIPVLPFLSVGFLLVSSPMLVRELLGDRESAASEQVNDSDRIPAA